MPNPLMSMLAGEVSVPSAVSKPSITGVPNTTPVYICVAIAGLHQPLTQLHNLEPKLLEAPETFFVVHEAEVVNEASEQAGSQEPPYAHVFQVQRDSLLQLSWL